MQASWSIEKTIASDLMSDVRSTTHLAHTSLAIKPVVSLPRASITHRWLSRLAGSSWVTSLLSCPLVRNLFIKQFLLTQCNSVLPTSDPATVRQQTWSASCATLHLTQAHSNMTPRATWSSCRVCDVWLNLQTRSASRSSELPLSFSSS